MKSPIEWWSSVRLAKPEAATQEAFERWRAADPANAVAVERTERVWAALGDIGELPEGRTLLEETARVAEGSTRALRGPPLRPGQRAWRYVQLATAAAVVLALVPFVSRLWFDEQYTTQTAEVRELTLPDGSRVTLGARSRIDVAFTEAERRVQLKGGEAFFDVRRNAAQPFTVEAGEALVRVLGTRFNVRRGARETNVAVLDGTVEVLRGREMPRRLEANQRATLKEMQSAVVADATHAAGVGAWRSGRLNYDGTPLIEVIADVNRYYPPGITLSEESLSRLKVTTAFEVGQIGLMINSLAVALPVVVDRRADGRVVISPRP